MTPDGDSFLPRIQSVFYAIFDVRQGPKIVSQVPEALIAVSNQNIPTSSSAVSFSSLIGQDQKSRSNPTSRASSASISAASSNHRPSFSVNSPNNRSSSTGNSKYLFHFDDVSKFVIPPSPLCGRLVTCATKDHRIIGFPVELLGKYERNYFRYNLCFVFERQADLSCYEPIVRKIARVFTACEEESAFLSSPPSPIAMLAILEQLYEDLNSYSETSIPIDAFNSMELKIFPFYPNPPPVKDWDVPLALINLAKRVETNWDLTIVKVIKHIDGVNHVSRIAYLADCDLDLTREAISHLLYYQVIMTIDIFQYSNMYTLRKSIQWLADEQHVRDECGLYVTMPGKRIPDFPKLLRLYSRLKPGKSVYEWAHDHDVFGLGVDVRRFVSFGVIKGFLRRIHRHPILIKTTSTQGQVNSGVRHNRNGSSSSLGRKRGKAVINSPTWNGQSQVQGRPQPEGGRGKVPKAPPTLASVNTELAVSARNSPISPLTDCASTSAVSLTGSPDQELRQQVRSPVQMLLRQQEKEKELSEAEKSLERLRTQTQGLILSRNRSAGSERSKERQQGDRADVLKNRLGKGITGSAFWNATLALSGSTLGTGPTAPRGLGASNLSMKPELKEGSGVAAPATVSSRPHRSPSFPSVTTGLKRSPSMPPIQTPIAIQSSSSSSPTTALSQSQPRTRPRLPSTSNPQRFANLPSSTSNPSGPGPLSHSTSQSAFPIYPKELLEMLDGEHHSDELGTKFEVGWPQLEAWLTAIPESEGKVEVIYR